MSCSSNLLEQSELLISKVKQYHFDTALSEIKDWPQSSNQAQRRIVGHVKGKIALIQGQYLDAIRIFDDTIKNEGAHLLILADLVACYFLSKQFSSWKMAVDQLATEVKTVGTKVHPINRYRIEIIMAKSIELQGSISEAYQKYLFLYQKASFQFRIKGLCNLVRMEAQYPLNSDFSKHYLALKQYVFDTEQPDYDSDVLHALLLAEAEHIDIQSALNLFQKMPRTQTCFFTFGFYELLDIFLRRDPKALSLLEKHFGSVAPASISDEKLLILSQGKAATDWYTWIHLMPLSQYFRLLRFIMKTLNSKDQFICLSQVHLMLKGLSSPSRNLWIQFFKKDHITVEKKLLQNFHYDKKTDRFFLNDILLDFGKQQLVKKLIHVLIQKKELSFNQLCSEIWNCEYNESYSHRIRHLALRINKLTQKEFLTEIIKITPNRIQLLESIQITPPT
jgi:hypothetical protein